MNKKMKSNRMFYLLPMVLLTTQLSCNPGHTTGGEEPQPPAPPSSTLEEVNDLIAFFDFNETGGLFSDYSGNNNHARIVGFPSNGWVLGINPSNILVDRAIDLGYTNRYAELSFTKCKSKQFGFSIWINPLLLDGSDAPMALFESEQNGGPNVIVRNDGAVAFWLTGDGHSKAISKAGLLKDNAWQNLSINYDGISGETTFYVNGTLTDQQNIEGDDIIIANKSIIGGYGGNGFFDGIIDNLVLYGRTLTEDEIQEFYNKQLPDRYAPDYTEEQITLKNTWPDPTYEVAVRPATSSSTDFPANPIEKEGWELTVHDEFDGPTLDESLWIPYYLRQRTSDAQALAEYEFRDGCIVLQISENKIPYSSTNRISSLQTAEGSNFHKEGSREIEGKVNFAQKYGYFEIRAKTQIGSGHLCAFWMVGSTQNPTENGEVDIFEQPGNAGHNALLFNLYKWNDPALTLPVDSRGWRNRLRTSNDLTTTFNIYGLEWNENEMKLYLNNELVNVIPKSPAYEMAVLLSLYEMDGDWVGDLDHTIDFPKEFAIDYFRAYKKKQ